MHASKRYLRTKQAAEYTGISASTLTKRRMRGEAPVFAKIGTTVYYDIKELDRLMASHRRRSTSEPGTSS